MARTLAILLASLTAVLLAAAAGYYRGAQVERGRAALEQQRAIVATFEAAHADAATEAERRAQAALRDARAAAAAREASLKGRIHALETDRPDCRWPADRRLLVNAAVAIANGHPDAAAGGLPQPLPDAARARP